MREHREARTMIQRDKAWNIIKGDPGEIKEDQDTEGALSSTERDASKL